MISEYKEAILLAEDNFNELSSLRPVLDSYGNPVMSSGNFAVVFKMRDENDGKLYAVKCFIKDQEGRNESYRKIAEELDKTFYAYLLPLQYLEKELFVDTNQCSEKEFPVVVMEWVEGEPLDTYLNQNLYNRYELRVLSYRFNRMAAWLLTQPIAHGDLKPDNILVRKDGSLVLVDYDGMYVPSMRGEKAREIGSPEYRHPSRTYADFSDRIDDFSIAVIALSLKVIETKPDLKSKSISASSLLFSEKDLYDLSTSVMFKKIQNLLTDFDFYNSDLMTLFGVFIIEYTKNNLDGISPNLLLTKFPKRRIRKKKITTGIFSEVEYDDSDELEDTEVDEYGFRYTNDGLKLLGSVKGYWCREEYLECKEYTVKAGTIEICDEAFSFDKTIEKVNIPNTVTSIGNYVFQGCRALTSVNIPESVTNIGINPFRGCCNLQLKINNGEYQYVNGILSDSNGCLVSNLNSSPNIIIPNYITFIGDSAFEWCETVSTIHFQNSEVNIGNGAFCGCASLKKVYMPSSIKSIGNEAFNGCRSLSKLYLPNSLQTIGDMAFVNCESLKSLFIPSSIVSIGANPFRGCWNLKLHLSENLRYKFIEGLLIDEERGILISYLTSKETVIIPKGIECIGEGAFWGQDTLRKIVLPQSVTVIESEAFYDCKSLTEISIPSKVTTIEECAFQCCKKLEYIKIPYSVSSIGSYAFSICDNLKRITIPKSTKYLHNTFDPHCKVSFKTKRDRKAKENDIID